MLPIEIILFYLLVKEFKQFLWYKDLIEFYLMCT